MKTRGFKEKIIPNIGKKATQILTENKKETFPSSAPLCVLTYTELNFKEFYIICGEYHSSSHFLEHAGFSR